MMKRLALCAIAAGLFMAAAAGVSIAFVTDASAEHPSPGMVHMRNSRQPAQPMMLRDVAAYIGAIGGAVMLIGGGWASWLHVKFNAVERKASGIGKALDSYEKENGQWRDTFMDRYRADREAMIREYATQVSLEKVEERMEAIRKEMVDGMQEITRSIDRMRETFKSGG